MVVPTKTLKLVAYSRVSTKNQIDKQLEVKQGRWATEVVQRRYFRLGGGEACARYRQRGLPLLADGETIGQA